MTEQKTCFVVMGFDKKTDYRTSRVLDLDKTYRHIIKPAVTDAGLQCIRADEIQHSGPIDTPMYEQLLSADLVIADLSTSNVNAAYELGVRHALRPRTTIVIAEDQFEFPFDVNHIVIRTYRHDGLALDIDEAQRFRSELQEAISAILDKEEADSPVYTFLKPLQPPTKEAAPRDADESAAHAGGGDTGAEADAPTATLVEVLAQAAEAKKKKDFATAIALLGAARAMAPRDAFIVQQLALLTYKSQEPTPLESLEKAKTILSYLRPMHVNDAETLGIWGAIHKRLWEETNDRAHLDTSVAAYEKGYRLLNDYYNGINFAYLLNVRASVSDRADAIADWVLANRVRKNVLVLCTEELERLGDSEDTVEDRYWVAATRAEAAFGLGDRDTFEKYMAVAEGLAGDVEWLLDSTREQLEKLEKLMESSPLEGLTD